MYAATPVLSACGRDVHVLLQDQNDSTGLIEIQPINVVTFAKVFPELERLSFYWNVAKETLELCSFKHHSKMIPKVDRWYLRVHAYPFFVSKCDLAVLALRIHMWESPVPTVHFLQILHFTAFTLPWSIWHWRRNNNRTDLFHLQTYSRNHVETKSSWKNLKARQDIWVCKRNLQSRQGVKWDTFHRHIASRKVVVELLWYHLH